MGHLLGTDAHSDRRRGPCIREAVEKLKEWLEPQDVEEIIYTIPQNIYGGKTVFPSSVPIEYHKKKGIFSFYKESRNMQGGSNGE